MKYIERVVNIDGTIEEKPYTANQLQELEKWKLEAQEQEEIFKNAAATKAVAEAKLAALGLTADDLKALGLGNN
jgi:hypothetical protein